MEAVGEQKNVQEPDINQLRKVRREKLADLQEKYLYRTSNIYFIKINLILYNYLSILRKDYLRMPD